MSPVKAGRASLMNASGVKKNTGGKNQDAYDELEEWKRGRQLLRPKSQLDLTEAELKETVTNQLTSTNPQQPESLVEFNYATGEFIPIPSPGNMVVIYEAQGTAIHKESEEAHAQMIEQGVDPSEYEVEEEEEEEQHEEEAKPSSEGQAAEEGGGEGIFTH